MNQEVRTDRALNGGHLTPQERGIVNQQQNRLSNQVYAGKHNAATQHYGNNEVDQRRQNQQARIANGIASGRLNAAQTSRLEKGEAAINRETRTDRALNGGHLTGSEKTEINRQQNVEAVTSTTPNTPNGAHRNSDIFFAAEEDLISGAGGLAACAFSNNTSFVAEPSSKEQAGGTPPAPPNGSPLVAALLLCGNDPECPTSSKLLRICWNRSRPGFAVSRYIARHSITSSSPSSLKYSSWRKQLLKICLASSKSVCVPMPMPVTLLFRSATFKVGTCPRRIAPKESVHS